MEGIAKIVRPEALIIGVNGTMGTGKTAVCKALAKYLKEEFVGADIGYTHAGYMLKTMAAETLGFTSKLHDFDQMADYFDACAVKKDMDRGMKSECICRTQQPTQSGYDHVGLVFVGEALQNMGKTIRKHLGEGSLIVSSLDSHELDGCNVIIVDGVRYQSDVDFIRLQGGFTVGVVTDFAAETNGRNREHESEQSLRGLGFTVTNCLAESEEDAVEDICALLKRAEGVKGTIVDATYGNITGGRMTDTGVGALKPINK